MQRRSGWDVAVAVILIGGLGVVVLMGAGFVLFMRPVSHSFPPVATATSSTSSTSAVVVATGVDPVHAEDESLAPARMITPQSLGLTFQPMTAAQGEPLGMKTGIAVSEIIPGSTADKAGVRVGDVAVVANGMGVTTVDEFQRGAGVWMENNTVQLLVRRVTPDGIQDHNFSIRVMTPAELSDLVPLNPPVPAAE